MLSALLPPPLCEAQELRQSNGGNPEQNVTLWALITLESRAALGTYPFLLRRREYVNLNLRGLVARHLNLTNFSFAGSDLRGADLTGSLLYNTDFSGADLSESVLLLTDGRGAVYDRSTKLPFSREEAARRGWIERSR